jgi:hypothetical protein
MIADLFGLPEMAAIVGGQQIEAGAKGHAEDRDSGKFSFDPGQVETVGLLHQGAEFGGDPPVFRERRIGAGIRRGDVLLGSFEFAPDRRLHGGNEFAHEDAIGEGALTAFVAGVSRAHGGFQLREAGAVDDVQVGDALGNGPAAGLGAPVELLARKAVGEGFGVAEIGIDFGDQNSEVIGDRHRSMIPARGAAIIQSDESPERRKK